MIKRIIFDIDNTLIEWKEEYYNLIEDVLNKLDIKHSKDSIDKIKYAIYQYEKKYNVYKKEYMLNLINEYSNLNLNINFIDLLLEGFSKCYDIPSKELIDTLEYLSKRYDLVILTNWFYDPQYKRLESMNISKYFSNIYSCEIFPIKPNKEAFIKAMNGYKASECIMIGDGETTDLKGAINVGMKCIHYDCRGKINKNYISIKNISELKDIIGGII